MFDAMALPCTIASFLAFLTCVFHFIDFYIFILFRIKGKCCSHVRIFLWDVVLLTFAWLYFIYAWIYFYLREGEKTLVSWPSPPFDIHLMKLSQVYSFCSFWSSLELLRWAHVPRLELVVTPYILCIVPYIFSRDVTTLMSPKCDDFFVCGHDGMIWMHKCWLGVTQIPSGGRSWHILLVPILRVPGFISLSDYPLEVVTPSKSGILRWIY